MNTLLNGTGFLGTHATFRVDLTLILILITAVMFTIGFLLVLKKHSVAHHWVQTTAVILNAIVVLSIMINSFLKYILPGIPGKLMQGNYAVTTLHALVGAGALVLGIIVLLRTSGLVPKPLRLKGYKPIMRTSYTLYMLATLLGVIVYITTYMGG